MPYIPNRHWKVGDKVQPEHLNHIEEGIVIATEEAEEKELPSSGNVGDVLLKTETGVKWGDSAGKIDIIKVDGEPLPIASEDKSVNIELADKFDAKVDKEEGKGLSEEDFTSEFKTKLESVEPGAEVNIQSDWGEQTESSDAFIKNKPTKLSQFTNNGEGTGSKFATEAYVDQFGGKIDIIKVNGEIQEIVDKTVDLTIVKKEYIDQQIAVEAETRAQEDATLNERIDNLEALGRYLSTWDCTTGLPATQPKTSPYSYKTGDYFIVSKVGEVNYKPTGTQYIKEVPSTEIETEDVKANDFYIFDSETWKLMPNAQRTVAFSTIAGLPEENVELKKSLDKKQDKLIDSGDNQNIKTINNQSILGKGNIEIKSGGGTWVIDPTIPEVPAWNSKLAPKAAQWNMPETSILAWQEY